MSEKKTRISAKVREAVRLMVDEGLCRRDAAAKSGISDHWLYQALREPSVLALKNELMQVLRTGAAARSIVRVDRLADTAESEHVRLQSNELLLTLDQQVPPARVQGYFQHEHLHHTPGLQIVFNQQPRIIDGTAVLVEQKRDPRFPVRVPHPSELEDE